MPHVTTLMPEIGDGITCASCRQREEKRLIKEEREGFSSSPLPLNPLLLSSSGMFPHQFVHTLVRQFSSLKEATEGHSHVKPLRSQHEMIVWGAVKKTNNSW